MSGRGGAEALLETVLVEEGSPRHLERHRARMGRSAQALGWTFSAAEFERAVEDALAEAAHPRARLRLLLAPGGSCIAALFPLGPAPDGVRLVLPAAFVHSASPLVRHKVLPRALYDAAREEAEAAGAWDGLLCNERGELCETGRANLVVLRGDELLTPPLDCGLLPGTVRGALLHAGAVREAVLGRAELDLAQGLFVTNALVGVRPVTGVEGSRYRPEPRAVSRALARMAAALA